MGESRGANRQVGLGEYYEATIDQLGAHQLHV